jgi:hypothetical protein
MPMDPERPAFFEGQVLAAADLTATVEHGRGQDARHERFLHDWGIAEGLELTKVDQRDANNNPFVEVTLQPGTAVAGTGREVVVATPVRLSEALFDQINGASLQPGAAYPVVLHGLDRDATRPSLSQSGCGGDAHPTRVQEGFEVTFRRVGDERRLDDQPLPAVDAGPDTAGGQPWDILLGFVEWDENIGRFTNATPDAHGVRRRYAGVKADRVAARGGRLELRPDLTVQAGKAALVVSGDPAALTFGIYKGDGSVEERFTVAANGDVTTKGTIKSTGALIQGEVRVQSGVATDGVILPLPPGITQQQVSGGQVILHTLVAAHVPPSAAPPTADLYHVDTCEVGADRRVTCVVHWFDLANPGQPTERPGAVDYLVVATVATESGAGP